jgi:hypothetical protein
MTGVGVDAQGKLVGYLQVCHDRIDGVSMYLDEDHGLGQWNSAPATTGFATWSLAAPSEPWTPADPLGNLKPNTTYSMYGWTSDNSWSTVHVTFTLEDLAKMKPGQVRWAGKLKGMISVETVTSEQEFRSKACQPPGS